MSGAVSRFQPQDEIELDSVFNSAGKYAAGIQELSNTFEVSSNLKLWWDSKVPEKNKRWYYFFNVTPSNREEVLKEIRKYEEFYKDLKAAVSNKMQQGDTDYVAHQMIIKDLGEKLSKMAKAAELGENSTSSSAIYELHKSFIKEHEKLKNMINHVELIVVRDGFNRSTQKVDTLMDKLRNQNKNLDEIRENLSRREDLSKQKQEIKKLYKENEKMRINLETMSNNLTKVEQERSKEKDDASKQQQELLECIKRLEKKQDALWQENQAIKLRLERSEHPE